jgi:rubrerythrin
MGSSCPKCHQDVEEDVICCAELKHTWKCRKCGKRSTGFVVPYGRCFLCGGENVVVEPYASVDVKTARVVEDAVQFEVNMYQFYRLGRERASAPDVRAVFEQLYLKEQDHLQEFEKKYHIHLENEVLEMPANAERLLAAKIFMGIDFDDITGQVQPLYERALQLEKRTRDHFARRARELPEGTEKEICRELAAEEEEHVSMLETELQQFTDDPGGA